jgi:hypothetical protein
MLQHMMHLMDQHRFLLAFLTILVAGGGCMRPYWPSEQVELRRLGVDEATSARLAGRADAPPGAPEPVCNLHGALLVVSLDHRNDGAARDHHDKVRAMLGPLAELHGVSAVGFASGHTLYQVAFTDQVGDPNAPVRPLGRALLDLAAREGADFLLVYTAATGAEVTDLTLTIGSTATLGTAPTKVVTGEAEVQAVLIDAVSGYVYALSDARGDAWGMTNYYNQVGAQYREDYEAQRVALRLLFDQLTAAWPDLRAAYP